MSRSVVGGRRDEAGHNNYSNNSQEIVETFAGPVLVIGDDHIRVSSVLGNRASYFYDQVAEAVNNMPEGDLKRRIISDFPDVIKWIPRIKEDLTETEPYES